MHHAFNVFLTYYELYLSDIQIYKIQVFKILLDSFWNLYYPNNIYVKKYLNKITQILYKFGITIIHV